MISFPTQLGCNCSHECKSFRDTFDRNMMDDKIRKSCPNCCQLYFIQSEYCIHAIENLTIIKKYLINRLESSAAATEMSRCRDAGVRCCCFNSPHSVPKIIKQTSMWMCNMHNLFADQPSGLNGNLPLLLSCGHTTCEKCVRSLSKYQEPIQCKICLQCTEMKAADVMMLATDKSSLYQLFPVNFQVLGELTLQLMVGEFFLFNLKTCMIGISNFASHSFPISLTTCNILIWFIR